MSVWVIGAINLDRVVRTASLPAPGETVMARGLSLHPGGKGANQAVAAARAGADTRLIGRVGSDEAGDWLLSFLRVAGVDLSGVSRDPQQPTGQAFITVSDEGENTIVVESGANAALDPAPGPVAEMSGVRVILAQLESGVEPVASLFRQPFSNCRRILNAAPATIEGRALFELADLLVFNETELAAYASLSGTPGDLAAIATAARTLMRRAHQEAVVTLGAQGALLVTSNDMFQAPGRRAKVVDTVGAGDCFCGVLAAGLDAGLGLPAAIERANAAAAVAVTRVGAGEAMPTAAEIDTALQPQVG